MLTNLALAGSLGYSRAIPVNSDLSVLSALNRLFQVVFENFRCDLIPDRNRQGCVARRNYSHVL
jgi:hypothetical protein